MTIIYTESEAIDNARSNLLWFGASTNSVADLTKEELIVKLKDVRSRYEGDTIHCAICNALILDLERPCPCPEK